MVLVVMVLFVHPMELDLNVLNWRRLALEGQFTGTRFHHHLHPKSFLKKSLPAKNVS